MSNDKRVCLITGVSSGMGEELARQMVQKKWHVIGISRNQSKMEELQSELGKTNFTFKACDVSDQNQIKKTVQELVNQKICPELFFLNAGDGYLDPPGKPSTELHHKTFAINYFGAISWIEEFVPYLENKKVTFVTTSSILATYALPNSVAYCASKAALKSCVDSLRRQNHNPLHNFILVMPGPVNTPLLKTPKPLPFTWQPEKAAGYIIQKVFQGKKTIIFPLFWRLFFQLLKSIPEKLTIKLLK